MSQELAFLQIPESLNSTILHMFYFLKINVVPKIVNRDEPGIEISNIGKARLAVTATFLSTVGTAGAQTMPQTCMSLGCPFKAVSGLLLAHF